VAEPKQYYVLGQEGKPVFIELGYEPGYGRILALAVYTSEGGGQQREDLQRYKDTEMIPMSAEEILALIPSGSCSTVFLDGVKLARSVFVGMLKTELGLPIKHPQWVRPIDPDLSE
jgi:hypothetical protein